MRMLVQSELTPGDQCSLDDKFFHLGIEYLDESEVHVEGLHAIPHEWDEDEVGSEDVGCDATPEGSWHVVTDVEDDDDSDDADAQMYQDGRHRPATSFPAK